MDERAKPNPDHLEDLVAYLDGELDDTVAFEIEQTLSTSADARNEVDALTRTWDMLDLLPKARATDQFTTRTLATIQVVEAEETTPAEVKSRRLKRNLSQLTLAAGVIAAAGVGFILTNRVIPTEHDLLVEELPLIENLDAYTEVESLDFLKQLQDSGLFDGNSHNNNP